MRVTRNSILTAVAFLLIASGAVLAQPRGPARDFRGNDLEVRVWMNKAEGKSYGQGEHAILYFQANRDCYVTIYDVNTRGEVNLLYPYEFDDPHFIEGGRVYTIPDYFDEFKLIVDGPPGTEYIQAVASTRPFDVPRWPSKYFVYEEYYPITKNDDRDAIEFLSYINERFFPIANCGANCAVDYTYLEVRRNWEYDWNDYYGYGGGQTEVHHYYHNTGYWYDPWDWSGTVYIGYPHGAAVYIDGIFYGYAPCFVPRVVVGWHHFRIWYNDIWWYDGRLNVCAGCWYDYGYDNIRYKDSRDHYGFKPKRRQGAETVSKRFHPNRKEMVYTDKSGYVKKETWKQEFATKKSRTDAGSPYFEGTKKNVYGVETVTSSKKGSSSSSGFSGREVKTSSSKRQTDVYKTPKVSTGASKKGYSGSSDSKKTGQYETGSSVKKGSQSPRFGGEKSKKTGSSESNPVFKPSTGSSKKSGSSSGQKYTPPSSSGKSEGSSGKSKGYSTPRTSPKSSGSYTAPPSSGKSSGGSYSAPKSSGKSSGGSKGGRSSGGKKKGG